MTRVLVTGGSGFLGAIVAQHLRQRHQTAFTFANRKVELEGCKRYHLNILRHETIRSAFDLFEPEAVVHCAAAADPAFCQRDPELARMINLEGTGFLLAEAERCGARFIHISTDLVFSGNNSPYSEDDEPEPISVYGEVKRAAELAVLDSESDVVVIRPALIYGPMPESKKGCFFHWMKKTLEAGEPLKAFEDEFRTPVFALDIARAIEKMIESAPPRRLYNLGGPDRVSRVDYAQTLCRIHHLDPIHIVSTRVADMSTGYPRSQDVSLISERIQSDLGLTLTPVEQGISESL